MLVNKRNYSNPASAGISFTGWSHVGYWLEGKLLSKDAAAEHHGKTITQIRPQAVYKATQPTQNVTADSRVIHGPRSHHKALSASPFDFEYTIPTLDNWEA